jgi:LysM repeat protein
VIYLIVIDAGHGGNDPGASGNGIIEKDLNLKISKYLYDRFKQLNIPVAMTRTTDETLSPDERVRRVLAAFGNKSNVVVLSNHINAGGGDGAEVIYALRDNDTLSKLITEELAKTGQNIRKWYQRRLPTDPSKDYFFIHRETGLTEPVIIEYGFLDSTLDDVNQLKNNYPKLAEAVVRAVTRYLKLPYSYPGAVGENYYTVVKGDSLYSIANKYSVTVSELKSANNLTSDALSIGQVLIIPTKEVTPPSGTTYIVQSGDSLWVIANKYGITVDQLKSANNLTTNLLSIGQVLVIPTKEVTPPSGTTYIVQSGDSLWVIANKYGITVDQLKVANNLTTNLLSIGQVLVIPTKEVTPPSGTTYIVQSGDSLWVIANKYGITVDQLKSANNLTTNLLSIGQKLIIPTK